MSAGEAWVAEERRGAVLVCAKAAVQFAVENELAGEVPAEVLPVDRVESGATDLDDALDVLIAVMDEFVLCTIDGAECTLVGEHLLAGIGVDGLEDLLRSHRALGLHFHLGLSCGFVLPCEALTRTSYLRSA